ncbi:MAG: hypothetical protein N2Z20_01875, partial [Elusimicrobiales bacterium]|nr:hypothetical protein [Elusimicrobiales bacterium]
LKKELSSSKYDAVIHLAAVSDYSPYLLITNSGIKIKIPSKQKISINENFCIKFKKNFKILNRLKIYSKNKNIKIIPFKLTSSASKKQVIYSIKKLKTEWVIHNDTSKIKRKSHPFTIYHNNIAIKSVKNAYELAKFFENILEDGGKNVSSCS